MNAIRTTAVYVRKEARDHRTTMLVLAGLLAGSAALAAFILPAPMVSGGAMISSWTVTAFLLAVAAIVAELAPLEANRRSLAFLERMPAGLGTAWCAKLAFALIALVGLTAFGWGAASVARAVRFPELFAHPVWVPQGTGHVLRAALVLPFAVMAVSTVLPRGALALPAVVLFAAPYAALFLICRGSHGTLNMDLHVIGWTIAFVLLSWIGFVRGRRHGRSLNRAALLFTGGLAVLGAPMWGHVAWTAWDWHRVAPADVRRLFGGTIGANGRFVFTNAGREDTKAPWHPVRIDLETGELRTAGARSDAFAQYHPLLRDRLRGATPIALRSVDGSYDPTACFDTATGRETGLGATDGHDSWFVDQLRRAARASTTHRTPAGQRAWVLRDTIEFETTAGGVESAPWDRQHRVRDTAGHGLLVYVGDRTGGHAVYDLGRRRLYSTIHAARGSVWVLGDDWLVADKGWRWRRWNPDTNAASPAPALRDGEQVVGLLTTARALVFDPAAGRAKRDALFGVDLTDGTRTPIALPPNVRLHPGRAAVRRLDRVPCDPAGNVFLFLHTADGRRHIAMLAPTGTALSALCPYPSFPLGSIAAGTLHATDGGKIVRLDFATGEVTTLFPREEGR